MGSALRPSSSNVLPACVDVRASSSTSSLTSIDRFALVLHLHHRGRTLLAPAACSRSPSSSSATLPRPHRNVAIRRPACVRPPRPSPPSSWCNVGAGLGTERTSASERPPSHAVVDILFFSGFCRRSYCLTLDTTHPSNRDTRHNVATTRQPYAPFFISF